MSWLTLLNLVLGLFSKVAELIGRERDRKAGADAQRVESAQASAKVSREMQDADAHGPRTGGDAGKRLRDGTF